MIGYLEGRILHVETDGILLQAGHVGYEVLLNPQLMEKLTSFSGTEPDNAESDNPVCLYIYYHQTERQPKPVLIGFQTRDDKEFFQTFITVSAIGPMKAIKAMTRPINEIALAIEQKDVSFLTGLAGIGKRTAEKIIATLRGKMEKFAAADSQAGTDQPSNIPADAVEIGEQVVGVLVEQLGHSPASAKRMVKEAFERDPDISTPEALFDEIYQEGQ